MTIYKGFSTVNNPKKFRLTDFELVKQDLINQLYTRQGEKLMNAKFGCVIWNLIFEQMTDDIKITINNDLMRIVKSDPRLRADSIIIKEVEHGLRVDLDLTFIPTNQTSKLSLTFDQNSKIAK